MSNFTPRTSIIFLKTHNLEETTAYWQGLLGLPLALDQGRCRIFRASPTGYIGFCLTDGPTGSNEVIFTMEIDDVDGFYLLMDGKGAVVEVKPRYNPDYQIYQMFLRDPNGYLVEVQRFLDPRWQKTVQEGLNFGQDDA
jgi:catechol 2,3-dioxygenase-like lactoylglutathione lyase family enzyme